MKIEPRHYRHAADRASLANLRAVKWFERLSKTLVAEDLETDFYLLHLSDNVLLTEADFPDYHGFVRGACDKLGVDTPPKLFLDTRPEPHSLCIGEQNPMIVLTSGLVELLEPDELEVALAHEVGHIACGHAYYQLLAENFGGVEQLAGVVPGLAIATMAFKLPLYDWYRKADFTADRAALIATGNDDAVMRMIGKIAGGSSTLARRIPSDALVRQADELETLTGKLKSGGVRKKATYLFSNIVMQGMFRSQPWPSVRMKELRAWADTDAAKCLMAGEIPPAALQPADDDAEPKGLIGRWTGFVQDAAKSVLFWEDEAKEADEKTGKTDE